MQGPLSGIRCPAPSSAARVVLTPYPADLMVAHKVSTRVNSVRNYSPELIEPIAA